MTKRHFASPFLIVVTLLSLAQPSFAGPTGSRASRISRLTQIQSPQGHTLIVPESYLPHAKELGALYDHLGDKPARQTALQDAIDADATALRAMRSNFGSDDYAAAIHRRTLAAKPDATADELRAAFVKTLEKDEAALERKATETSRALIAKLAAEANMPPSDTTNANHLRKLGLGLFGTSGAIALGGLGYAAATHAPGEIPKDGDASDGYGISHAQAKQLFGGSSEENSGYGFGSEQPAATAGGTTR